MSLVSYNEVTRTIYFSDEVNEESALLFCSIVEMFNMVDNQAKIPSDKREPIKLVISSPGGKVYSLFDILNAMEKSVTPIDTYCSGMAASCAFIMFISGRKRYLGKHGTILCHQVSAGTMGTLQEMEECFEEIKDIQGKLEEIILEKTKITREQLADIKTRKYDWRMGVKKAIKLGCADEIW